MCFPLPHTQNSERTHPTPSFTGTGQRLRSQSHSFPFGVPSKYRQKGEPWAKKANSTKQSLLLAPVSAYNALARTRTHAPSLTHSDRQTNRLTNDSRKDRLTNRQTDTQPGRQADKHKHTCSKQVRNRLKCFKKPLGVTNNTLPQVWKGLLREEIGQRKVRNLCLPHMSYHNKVQSLEIRKVSPESVESSVCRTKYANLMEPLRG